MDEDEDIKRMANSSFLDSKEFEENKDKTGERSKTQFVKSNQVPIKEKTKAQIEIEEVDNFETGSNEDVIERKSSVGELHFDEANSGINSDTKFSKTNKSNDIMSDGSYMRNLPENTQIVDDMSSQASYMIKVPTQNNDDMSSQGSYMVRAGQSGHDQFDDMSSSGSYMKRIGTSGGQQVDDMSSQGSYMVRMKNDDISSQGSYMIKGGTTKFDDMSSQGSYIRKVDTHTKEINDFESEGSMRRDVGGMESPKN